MLVVQTKEALQGVPHEMDAWIRPPLRKLRGRVQTENNGGQSMSSAGADMQAVRNRWLQKRKSQMAKWLNGFKPSKPKTETKRKEKVK